MSNEEPNGKWVNLGSRRIPKLRMANFPDADAIVS